MERRYADRAPKVISRDDGDFFVCEGMLTAESGVGLLATKRKYDHPEVYDFSMIGRWSEVPEPGYDPAARLKELDREGIEGELLYSSYGLIMYSIPDHEFRYALMVNI